MPKDYEHNPTPQSIGYIIRTTWTRAGAVESSKPSSSNLLVLEETIYDPFRCIRVPSSATMSVDTAIAPNDGGVPNPNPFI